LLFTGHAIDEISTSVLWYDRRQPSIAPDGLSDYVKGTHHLYLRQVPSALTLKKAGGPLGQYDRAVLLEDGFSIFREANESKGIISEQSLSDFQQEADSLSTADSTEIEMPWVEPPKSNFQYEDPFKVLAGWAYAQKREGDKPQIFVWPGGCNRLQSPI